MHLLMRRSRLERGIWYSFKINVRLVPDEEEKALVDKYFLVDVVLTPGDTWRDLKRSGAVSLPLALLGIFVFHFPPLLVIIGCVVIWILLYHQLREEVRVNDLLIGRDFRARSLIDLLAKEQKIRQMSDIFTEVVNQSRTWEEPEVVELAPRPIDEILGGVRAVP